MKKNLQLSMPAWPVALALILCFSFTTYAQTPQKLWDKTFGGNGLDKLNSLQQTSDGGYILGGLSGSGISEDKTEAGKGSTDFWIVKIDASGNKQWDKAFGGNNYDILSSLQQTSDGGYILGGYSSSGISGNKTEISKGGSDFWIVKTDASGNKQWDKTFGGNNYDELFSLQQTSDGGYILGGYALSGISEDKTEAGRGGYDYWIVKTDASGNKQWDKTFGGNDDDYLHSLQQTSDGGYILGGSSYSGISGDKATPGKGYNDYWIVKIDASGNKQWDKTFGGNYLDESYSLQQTSDGGYILGGYALSGISGDKTESGRGDYDYWIVKTDASGNKQWDKTFGGNDDDYLYSLQQTSDGGYILGGGSYSGISGDRTGAGSGVADYWIVKIDGNGNKQWDKAFGGNDYDFLSSLQQTSDDGYILGGYSISGIGEDKTEANKGDYDYWILKLCAGNIYYRDADGDGYGDANSIAVVCSSAQPPGYVADNTDCDDTRLLYADADGDGYGAGAPVACGVADSTDCNDNDPAAYKPVVYYRDTDGDGYGDSVLSIVACSQPPGYVSNKRDCDDANPAVEGFVKFTYYKDADGDGYGDSSVSIVTCSQPPGYVTNKRDCDDANPTVGNGLVKFTFYRDADGDGYGNQDSTIVTCSLPPGYVTNKRDCDDANPTVGKGFVKLTYYRDADGDGYGNEDSSILSCSQPSGYVLNKKDCDDANTNKSLVKSTFYRDADGDGYGDANSTTAVCSSTPPPGYVTNNTDCDDTRLLYADADGDSYGAGAPVACGVADNTDCNDNDPAAHRTVTYYRDADGDGYGNSAISIVDCSQPPGYVTNKRDCDDANPTIENFVKFTYYRDADGDGYGDSVVSIVACSLPPGYVTNKRDCDDTNPTVGKGFIKFTYYRDADGDGYGDSVVSIVACSQPPGYVTNKRDCDDANPAVGKGKVKFIYYRDADADGYGNIDSAVLSCSQPAGYVLNKKDCNDADAAIHPNAVEICDGKDNDCNGRIDENCKAMSSGSAIALQPGTRQPAAASPYLRNFVISPNPTGNKANLILTGYSGKITIRLMDMNGKIIDQYTIEAFLNYAQKQIDVSRVANGIYFVTATDVQGNFQTEKLMIAK